MSRGPFAAFHVFPLFVLSQSKSAAIFRYARSSPYQILMFRKSLSYGLGGVRASRLKRICVRAILLTCLFLTAIPSRAQVGANTAVAPTSRPCDSVKQRQAFANLGAEARIEFDRNQIPTWIRGLNVARTSQDPVEAALATLRTIKDVFCGSADDDFRFTGRMSKEDKLGQTAVRIKQTYRGLDVVGPELIVHMTREAVIKINGQFIAGISLPTEAAFDGQRAQQIALDHIAALGGLNSKASEAEPLVVFADDKDKVYLAYPVIVAYELKTGKWWKDGPHRDRMFVDAIAGTVVGTNPLVFTVGRDREIYDGSQGGYSCGLSPIYPVVPLIFGDQGGTTDDQIAISAYDNTGLLYDFYFQEFGRDSYDNAGGVLNAIVHDSCDQDNAQWDGFEVQFGDGDGVRFGPFPQALDVVSHEWTHAVDQYTANLTYSGESGALNESFSDALGESAECFETGSCDWKIAEGIWIPEPQDPPCGALRCMFDPPQDGLSVDYYPNFCTQGDCADPHFNSGIGNLAYFLLANGGEHPQKSTNTFVHPIGVGEAQQIWYRALEMYLQAGSTYSDARVKTAEAAADLYGYCSQEWQSVQAAWDAVGVPNSTSCQVTSGGQPLALFAGGDFGEIFPHLNSGQILSGNLANNNVGACAVPGACSGVLSKGSSITLITHPTGGDVATWVIFRPGGVTSGTSGSDFGNTIIMNGPVEFVAFFGSAITFTVNQAGGGSGLIKSSDSNIFCPSKCTSTYAQGAQFSLTAFPSVNSYFTGWSGSCSGSPQTITITVNSASPCTANFQLITLQVSETGTGTGKVTSSSGGISCPSSCSATFNAGTRVALTPSPTAGSFFAGWSGACSGIGACVVDMISATSVTASFVVPDFSVSAAPTLQVVSGAGSTTYTVTLTPVPVAGFTGSVSLSLTGQPTNASYSFNPNPVQLNGTAALTSALTVTVPSTAGKFPLTITAASGTHVHTATVTVECCGTADFSISGTSSETLVIGNNTSYMTMVSPLFGFTGTVALSLSGLPSGVTGVFSPPAISGGSGSSTLTLSASNAASSGTYSFAITGISGSLTHSTSVQVVVPILVSVSPASVSLTDGQKQQFTSSVAGSSDNSVTWRNGPGVPLFADLFATITQTGLFTATDEAAPATTILACSTVEISSCGLATVSIAQLPDFRPELQISGRVTTSVTVPVGGSTPSGRFGSVYAVQLVSLDSFAGNVTLSVSGLPSGVTAAFATNPVALSANGRAAGQITFTASTSANVGTYPITLTGVSGGTTHAESVELKVETAVVVSPATITLSGGQQEQFTAQVLGNPSQTVNWYVNPYGGVTSSGLFTMAQYLPSSTTTTVTACTTSNPSVCGSTTVTTATNSTPGFYFSVSPYYYPPSQFQLAAVLPLGTSISYQVQVVPVNGFTGNVTLNLTGLPNGITANFNPSVVNITGTSSVSSFFTLTASSSAPLGSYVPTLTGTSGSTTATVPAPSFATETGPTIVALSVTSAAAGASITISGSGFGSGVLSGGGKALGDPLPAVTFNGAALLVQTWSPVEIQVQIPATATTGTGNMVVTINGVASNSATFVVLPGPLITGLSNSSGVAGSLLTIAGQNFGQTQGQSSVQFSQYDCRAQVVSWSPSAIQVRVPTTFYSGSSNVTVNLAGSVASNTVTFTALPSISELWPSSGGAGTQVNLFGSALYSTSGSITVSFNGKPVVLQGAQSSGFCAAVQVGVAVPTGASSGNVSVNSSGTLSNSVKFTVN